MTTPKWTKKAALWWQITYKGRLIDLRWYGKHDIRPTAYRIGNGEWQHIYESLLLREAKEIVLLRVGLQEANSQR